MAAPKPAPDPYLEACRRLGVEPGPDVVALEDSPTGVAAARAAGPDGDRCAFGGGCRPGGGAPHCRVAARRGDRPAPRTLRIETTPLKTLQAKASRVSLTPAQLFSPAVLAAAAGPARRSRVSSRTLRSCSGLSSPRSAMFAASSASSRRASQLGHVRVVRGVRPGAGQLDQQRLEADPQLQGGLAGAAGVEVGAGSQQQRLAGVDLLSAAEHGGDPLLRAQLLLAPRRREVPAARTSMSRAADEATGRDLFAAAVADPHRAPRAPGSAPGRGGRRSPPRARAGRG